MINTPHHIRHLLPGPVRRRQLQHILPLPLPADTQHRHHLLTFSSLAVHDGRVIRVDDAGAVGEVAHRVDADGVVAEAVEEVEELVLGGGWGEGGEPDGFAVGGDAGAGEALFLALVDHGDAVGEDGPG